MKSPYRSHGLQCTESLEGSETLAALSLPPKKFPYKSTV